MASKCPKYEPSDCEQWRAVVGFEGYYEVSDRGRVRSVDRVVKFKNGKLRKFEGTIISLYRCGDGARKSHWHVHLYRGGKVVAKAVHHLVLEAFVGSRPEGLQALHGANGSLSNCVGNLYYGTSSRNHGEDRVRDGTDNRGEKCGSAKLTAENVLDIRRRVFNGETQARLVEEYGVSTTAVSQIIGRKRWRHI